MNLDKMIRILLIKLSEKYTISLVEIQKPKFKEQKISKVINFNYRLIDSPPTDNECISFHNKRELVSWLMCLE